jgi:hypothetical protein
MAAVRPARPGEAAGLTGLCLRSKAHWGYDAAFMRLCVPSLTVKEEAIKRGRSGHDEVKTGDSPKSFPLFSPNPALNPYPP